MHAQLHARTHFVDPLPAYTVGYETHSTDKFLTRPDWKKQLKDLHYSSDEEAIAVAETWLEGQPEFFLSGLQKLEFGRCSFISSWSV